jgi:hypothetical protein
MTRQFKFKNGLNYVITDGEEIDYIRYDNQDNIVIVMKQGHGFMGKLVREEKPWKYDYPIGHLKSEELDGDRRVVAEERKEFPHGSYIKK